MSTTDLANYGTVLSYAVDNEDNELTFTDYGGFVLSIKGIFVYIKFGLNLLYNIFSWYISPFFLDLEIVFFFLKTIILYRYFRYQMHQTIVLRLTIVSNNSLQLPTYGIMCIYFLYQAGKSYTYGYVPI